MRLRNWVVGVALMLLASATEVEHTGADAIVYALADSAIFPPAPADRLAKTGSSGFGARSGRARAAGGGRGPGERSADDRSSSGSFDAMIGAVMPSDRFGLRVGPTEPRLVDAGQALGPPALDAIDFTEPADGAVGGLQPVDGPPGVYGCCTPVPVITPTPPTAVPEPVVWAGLLVGYACLGTLLRWERRRRDPRVAGWRAWESPSPARR